MAQNTDFFPVSAYRRMEQEGQVLTNLIDFAKAKTAVASGDTVKAIRIPKGMIVQEVALAVHTTEATVTIAVGDSASGTQFLAAQTLTDLKADNVSTTADGAAMSANTTKKFYGAEDYVLLTIAGADADTAVISVTVTGVIVAKTQAETAVEA